MDSGSLSPPEGHRSGFRSIVSDKTLRDQQREPRATPTYVNSPPPACAVCHRRVTMSARQDSPSGGHWKHQVQDSHFLLDCGLSQRGKLTEETSKQVKGRAHGKLAFNFLRNCRTFLVSASAILHFYLQPARFLVTTMSSSAFCTVAFIVISLMTNHCECIFLM